MIAASKSRRKKSRWIEYLISIACVSVVLACSSGAGGNNEIVDDGDTPPVPTQTWYADLDHDGFGNLEDTIEAVHRPDGYLSDHSDCQDLDPSIHPDATEICGDGIDQDCSGDDLTCETDDDPVQTWYADTDADGFGDINASIEAVLRPSGYVSDHSDCQDRDPSIHPDATEVCGDGIDQDCSGEDLACDPTPTPARFGIITDIHHSNRPDTTTRKYSAARAKTAYFVARMDQEEVDFVIELGDIVDRTVDEKDPLETLSEIDGTFTSFQGPHYHVLGNHEFDSIGRMDLLNHLDNTGILAGETYYSYDLNGLHCIVLDADYTVAEPHQPFDMIEEGQIAWWHWTAAWVPQAQLDWLEADLTASDLPTLIFSHQALHLDASVEDSDDFMIKNAAAVRSLLEADGQVLAAFSGHDHRGATTTHNNIHYFGLAGNVGLERDWSEVSPTTNGLDPIDDNPFALIEIELTQTDPLNGLKSYRVEIKGNAQQDSWIDEVRIASP